MNRRELIGIGGGLALAGCAPRDAASPAAVWVGAKHQRGHRLRDMQTLPTAAVNKRAGVLIVGAGIAGLSAARAYARKGVADVQVLELEDEAGGNSRGHRLAGMGCPLGAHYLPVPPEGPELRELNEWLHEIGLLKTALGRTRPDERHLCHSPQERLFIDGAWVDGLLPPSDPASESARQTRAFAAAITRAQATASGARAYALPAHRAPWSAEQQALNTQTFAQWLDAQGLVDARLRWYLDYACRDDYGAGCDTVSAWAGVHYFASRHGFHAPGDNNVDDADRDAVFTWPEGNAWLAQRLAAPLQDRLHSARTVLRVTETRHGVQVLAWDERAARAESWTADRVVLAVPLFIAARLVESPPQALRDAAALLAYAPWLVANLQLNSPLLDRPGAPPSWDNVIFGSSGLGYVDAMHQSLNPQPGATVLTAYHALPREQRKDLLATDANAWAQRVLQELRVAHPDIDRRVQAIELMRWGHAMAIPRPGVQRHPALLALRAMRGRVRYAHADLAGYSVFEEAFIAGCEVASV